LENRINLHENFDLYGLMMKFDENKMVFEEVDNKIKGGI
jgi:hypothetical protein